MICPPHLPQLAAVLTLSHGAVDAVASINAALLPTLHQRFGLTETGLVLLVAVLSVSSSVTQPLFGALADRDCPQKRGGQAYRVGCVELLPRHMRLLWMQSVSQILRRALRNPRFLCHAVVRYGPIEHHLTGMTC
jgi:MFS family permease